MMNHDSYKSCKAIESVHHTIEKRLTNGST